MKTKDGDSRYPQHFSPADFPLGSPESRAAARFCVGCSPVSLLLADWRKEQEAGVYEGPAMRNFFAYLETLDAEAKAGGKAVEEHVSGREFVRELVDNYGVRAKEQP